MTWLRLLRLVLLVSVLGALAIPSGAGAVAPAPGAFERTWARTDKPVKDSQTTRTWMWGPEANTGLENEPYAEAPGGQRHVQYFDKSRMEDNSYRATDAPWDVTNGLLVVELITGRLQRGDNQFEEYASSQANVAGDPDDANGPTYATFKELLHVTAGVALPAITQVIRRDGVIQNDSSKAGYAIPTVHFAPETHHWIAKPFWDFMNASGTIWENGSYVQASLFQSPYYATGLPITDPFWSNIKVANQPRDVLMQCFERRCLTYTPANAAEWQVEMGNVGQHYRRWRYEEIPGSGEPECPDSPQGTYAYVVDTLNGRVQKFTGSGAFVCQIDGDDLDGVGNFLQPEEVAVDPRNNDVLILSSGWIHRFNREGRWLSSFGDWELSFNDLVVDGLGNIVGIDLVASEVVKLSPTGTVIKTFGSEGSGPGQFNSAAGITVDDANYIYVADRNNYRVQKFDPAGGYITAWGDSNLFDAPEAITVGSPGVVYVGDLSVYAFTVTGAPIDTWDYTSDWAATRDMDAAHDGTLLTLDTVNTQVVRFSITGEVLNRWGSQGSGQGQFNGLSGIATATR
jgi:hypothetical protein